MCCWSSWVPTRPPGWWRRTSAAPSVWASSSIPATITSISPIPCTRPFTSWPGPIISRWLSTWGRPPGPRASSSTAIPSPWTRWPPTGRTCSSSCATSATPSWRTRQQCWRKTPTSAPICPACWTARWPWTLILPASGVCGGLEPLPVWHGFSRGGRDKLCGVHPPPGTGGAPPCGILRQRQPGLPAGTEGLTRPISQFRLDHP